ncbi:MAG: hypothetical protein FJW88_01165 [Actinobacteria bacterium]|nr:hypothetical protein [Actinomycetota bacterium]
MNSSMRISLPPSRRGFRRVAVATALLALVAALFPLATSARPAAAATATSVQGPSTLTPQQIARWFASTGKTAAVPMSVEALASLYVWEGASENVRGDIAFAQSVVETGYFGFVGSIVRPENYNYAGMGACDSCSGGRQFPSPQIGIRAQIQHLKNYADLTSRASGLANPPVPQWYAPTSLDPVVAARNFDTFFAKGRAPTWAHMGNGNWATSTSYATTVLSIYNKMLVYNGLPAACPPDGLGFGSWQAVQCPATLRAPGRAVAGAATGGAVVVGGTGAVKTYGAGGFGAPTFGFDIARDVAVMPDGQGYIVLDGYGGLHKYGSAATGVMGTLYGAYWPGWDIARSISITPDGQGLLLLDAWGGVHSMGTAPRIGGPYWRGWDIARAIAVSPDGQGAYLLDGFGGVWPLGTATSVGAPYFGWDIARDIAAKPGGYVVLDGFGGVHGYGTVANGMNPQYFGADRFRGVTILSDGRLAVVRNDGVYLIL